MGRLIMKQYGMSALMNLMNLMKLFWGHGGFEKKYRDIFSLKGCEMLILGSLKFIWFIKSGFCGLVGRVAGLIGGFGSYLMNLMNVYVVRLLNGFFGNSLCTTG